MCLDKKGISQIPFNPLGNGPFLGIGTTFPQARAFTLVEIIIALAISALFFEGMLKITTMISRSFNSEQIYRLLNEDVKVFSSQILSDVRTATDFQVYTLASDGSLTKEDPQHPGNCLVIRYGYNSTSITFTNCYSVVYYVAPSSAPVSILGGTIQTYPLYRYKMSSVSSIASELGTSSPPLGNPPAPPSNAKIMATNVLNSASNLVNNGFLFRPTSGGSGLFYRTLNNLLYVNAQFMRTGVALSNNFTKDERLTCQLLIYPRGSSL